MTPTPRIAILIPLAVGASATIATIFVHAIAVRATVKLVRHEEQLGRAGASFWVDVVLVLRTMALALVAHMIDIALWAVFFLVCGEFVEFGTAFYHSAVNYTTLGYGDLIMTPSWKLLGPLEAANGALMFGVSTGMIFALIQLLIQARLSGHPRQTAATDGELKILPSLTQIPERDH
jgi:Ion channel